MTPLLVALIVATGPHFVEDDFAAALASAKASKKLLFVDAWAPWCHSCVFMREHVMTREGFVPYEKDVVFAAVDTEKAGSAAFLEQYPVDVWPTLFFIDPQTGKLVFKWVGSTDEAQMKALLDAARGGGGLVSEADALMAEGKSSAAAQKYLAAQQAGEGKSARSVLSMLSALALSKSNDACARASVEQLPLLTSHGDQVNALSWGLGCAAELPPGADRTKLLATLVAKGTAALAFTDVLADDKSGLYESLSSERFDAKDEAGGVALAKQWLAFLEGEAAKAKTPAERAVFDPHRVNAAIAAKTPERMVEPLMLSEKQLGGDYNPPARLALIQREQGKYDEALASIDRALVKCKAGPRKLRLYETKASILEKQGDAAGRKKVLGEALTWARALPKAQYPPARLAAFEKRVAEVK
jgi:thioredoxin-like negative regulator of GroEL